MIGRRRKSAWEPSRGTGGWLGLLIVSLCFGALASAVGTIMLVTSGSATMDRPGAFGFKASLVIIGSAQTAGFLALVWLLDRRRSPRTPRLAVIGLWSVLAVPAALQALTGVFWWGQPAGPTAASVIRAFLPDAIYAAICSIYLLASKRVANTYAGAIERQLAARFE